MTLFPQVYKRSNPHSRPRLAQEGRKAQRAVGKTRRELRYRFLQQLPIGD